MKTIFLSIIIILTYGCDGAYPKETRWVVIELGGRGEVDSITLIKDTFRIYRAEEYVTWYKSMMHPKDSFSMKFDSIYFINGKAHTIIPIGVDSINITNADLRILQGHIPAKKIK